jgi:hypothetical protein
VCKISFTNSDTEEAADEMGENERESQLILRSLSQETEKTGY